MEEFEKRYKGLEIEPQMQQLWEQQQADGILRYDILPGVESTWWYRSMPYLISLAVLALFLYFLYRQRAAAMGSGGGAPGASRFGHARTRTMADQNRKVTFDDVAGADEEKEELQEVPESDQEEENSAEPEVSYTEDYDQPAEEEAEPYEEAEVTSYETQPVEPVQEEAPYEEPVQEEVGDINPYTGREYESNSVRMHPKRIGYVQVYDRANHKWTDMTEWAFLGYQERKKVLLGEDYEPPIYLD